MAVEFLVENVEKYISAISKILPTHPQLPVISNILLEATQEGLFLSATDLELGIRVKIPAKIEVEGAVTVPGKQFIEVVGSLHDKVKLVLENDSLTLESRGNRMVFATIPKDEFPNLFTEKGEELYMFSKNEFSAIFSKLIFATSIDESRPQLTGIYITQKDGYIDFVSTDGYRMSLSRLEGKKILPLNEGLILPTKLVTEVLALKEGDETLRMYLYRESNQVLFETANITLVGRIIGGEFPNYTRVIPTSHKTTVTASCDEFITSLRLASVFARESANIVKIRIEENTIQLFSKSSGVGEGEVKFDVEKEGEDNEIAFNVKFLNDLLKNSGEKTVMMELSSGLEPSVFKLEKDTAFLHIIMPVRVQE